MNLYIEMKPKSFVEIELSPKQQALLEGHGLKPGFFARTFAAENIQELQTKLHEKEET
jgi:hypothetical protein